MSKIKDLGEFGLIDRIKKLFPSPDGVVGIGDDCAVIPQQDGYETVVSTDMLVEGSHFLRSHVQPYQLGWKTAAVNFSDIAAMGGSPVGSFLAIALPDDLRTEWLDEFLRGYKDISDKYGFALLGGDTTSSRQGISICVTVMGRTPTGSSRKRSAAKVGDLICVTGPLGDSALGLELVLSGRDNLSGVEAALVQRHYLPSPRISEGKVLASIPGVHAMMDISDGVASDLLHIMRASAVGAEVDCSALPLSDLALAYCASDSAKAVKAALCGGEDYELLFTADCSAVDALRSEGVELHPIGRVTAPCEGRINWKNIPCGLSDSDLTGFRHF